MRLRLLLAASITILFNIEFNLIALADVLCERGGEVHFFQGTTCPRKFRTINLQKLLPPILGWVSVGTLDQIGLVLDQGLCDYQLQISYNWGDENNNTQTIAVPLLLTSSKSGKITDQKFVISGLYPVLSFLRYIIDAQEYEHYQSLDPFTFQEPDPADPTQSTKPIDAHLFVPIRPDTELGPVDPFVVVRRRYLTSTSSPFQIRTDTDTFRVHWERVELQKRCVK